MKLSRRRFFCLFPAPLIVSALNIMPVKMLVPSEVNEDARWMMAEIRRFWEDQTVPYGLRMQAANYLMDLTGRGGAGFGWGW